MWQPFTATIFPSSPESELGIGMTATVSQLLWHWKGMECIEGIEVILFLQLIFDGKISSQLSQTKTRPLHCERKMKLWYNIIKYGMYSTLQIMWLLSHSSLNLIGCCNRCKDNHCQHWTVLQKTYGWCHWGIVHSINFSAQKQVHLYNTFCYFFCLGQCIHSHPHIQWIDNITFKFIVLREGPLLLSEWKALHLGHCAADLYALVLHKACFLHQMIRPS